MEVDCSYQNKDAILIGWVFLLFGNKNTQRLENIIDKWRYQRQLISLHLMVNSYLSHLTNYYYSW
jgi:hypothetical protein